MSLSSQLFAQPNKNTQETEHIQMQTTQHKLALKQHKTHSKTLAKREDRQSLVWSPFTTSDQEMEQVHSFNSGLTKRPGAAARTGTL